MGAPAPEAGRPALGDACSRLNVPAAPGEAASKAGKGADPDKEDPDKEVALRTLRSIYTSVAALAHSPARKAKGQAKEKASVAAGRLPPPR